jgi:hypothetical protein
MLRLAAPLVLPYSADQWAAFIAQHSLGAFALAWVAGITFMLTMTITVLQLREVRVATTTLCYLSRAQALDIWSGVLISYIS